MKHASVQDTVMSTGFIRPLLASIALLLATAACSKPDTPEASAQAARYGDLELHIGEYAPVHADAMRTPMPGERLWTTHDGTTAYLVHALTIPDSEIESVTAGVDTAPFVRFVLTPAAGARIQALTGTHVGKAIGIVTDDTLQSVATIQGVLGREFQLTAISAEHADTLVSGLQDMAPE